MKQTESLLKNGYVTGRGKLQGGLSAFAGGTAYAVHPYTSGMNIASDWENITPTLDGVTDSVSDAADEFAESLDWIEIRLEELDETIGLLNAQLENATTSAEKNSKIDEIIAKNREKMANLEAGADYYESYIDKFWNQIPEEFREATQNGAIAITDFAGEASEEVVEAIQNYRDYVQKAADLRQQKEETKTEIRDLAIQKFDNAYAAGDVKATVEDSQTEKLQNAVDYDETRGLITSDAYYVAMMENSNKKIEYLTNARQAMQKELDAAVKAGQIERGSNEWYELIDKMYQVDAQIDEATIELEEFQNAINDIYWDNFDQLINRIDSLKNETQSLIDLMDNADMVTKPEGKTYEGGTVKFWTADDVEWTDEGLASLGLYAQQMEVAEYQAKQYAEAIDDLTEDYENGLYSENEYLEKLNELKDGQYENIEAYYDAQDAIKDLNKTRVDAIKEGIEKEIEAYEELIEKQKEQLDAEKDLYDFQRTTMESQKNIADIERKLAALANDHSLSAAAKRKQLEAELAEANYELQETYYNRSIEDKQSLLDQELKDFQTEKDAEIVKWDEYLTNVETLVAESLGIVQANAAEIGQTLTDKANEYNLTVSDAILSPWQDGALAVSDYQSTFDTAMSSTTGQLDTLKNKWQEVINKMAEAGNASVTAINLENKKYTAATPTSTISPTTPTTTPKKDNSQQKADPKVGDTVKVKSSATHFSSQSNGLKMASFVPGGSYSVMQVGINGDTSQILIGKNGAVTGWVWKKDLEGYAKGTTNLEKSGIINVDELGEELLLRAKNGRLTYMEKGSGIVPADLTSNLMKWGKLDPQDMLDQSRPQIAPSKSIINTEISIDCSVGTMVNIEHCDQNTLPDVEKIVNKAFDKHIQTLNNSIRRYTR